MNVFGCWQGLRYRRLMNVLRDSLWTHVPDVISIFDPMGRWPQVGFRADTGAWIRKLETWAWFMQQTTDLTVFMDVDTYVRGDIREVFAGNTWDVAVTAKDADQHFNSGVVFARPTKGARAFFENWLLQLYKIVLESDGGESERKEHGSVDQAAVARIVAAPPAGCNVGQLPCVRWNACQQHWENVDETTMIVHVKSELRPACLGEYDGPISEKMRLLINEWVSYDQES